MEKAKELIVKIIRLLSKPEMRILPGQLAFFLVLTIIPLVALIATMAAALSISTDSVRYAISSTVPNEIATLINTIVTGDGISVNMIIFYASAFILASNGTYSMINTSNEIYKVKPKNVVSRRIKAIYMTFILIGLFLFLILVPIFGNTIFDILKEIIDTNKMLIITKIINIIKYPIILVILFFNIKLMYVIAPDQEISGKTVNKGAFFTTILWIVATEIFAFYVEKFARYDVFYGSISNILILLLWVYLLSYIYVFGMIINASNYNILEEKES